jgi:valyl-tRNA synthetase
MFFLTSYIYDLVLCRDYRLVNWDCTLLTAISDIEVDEAYYIVVYNISLIPHVTKNLLL